jgi:hypothetical protein
MYNVISSKRKKHISFLKEETESQYELRDYGTHLSIVQTVNHNKPCIDPETGGARGEIRVGQRKYIERLWRNL